MDNLTSFKIITGECNLLNIALNSSKENVAELERIKMKLLDEYNSYNAKIYSLNSMPSESIFKDVSNERDDKGNDKIFLKNRELMKNFYEKPPSKLNNELVKRRYEHGLIKCPYCGYPEAPDTLDHFMPKGNWPEFALFHNNLVPQCEGCAPTKGERYFSDEENLVKFIHPFYFDLLTKINFKIVTDFENNTNTISFNLEINLDEDMEDNDIKRIKLHFKELKIKGKLISFCQKEFLHWKRLLEKKNFDIKE